VLIRDIRLPPFIVKAIEAKKEREQEVEKQPAEIERLRTDQQQQVAAAEEQATRQRVLAEARAYQIERPNQAVGNNPSYLKLQALEALQAVSKDPAAKVYLLHGDSPTPLPLMHLSDDPRPGRP
jgi:regulator of protease activity HflC (stomatin/prohibitin superfamily)